MTGTEIPGGWGWVGGVWGTIGLPNATVTSDDLCINVFIVRGNIKRQSQCP